MAIFVQKFVTKIAQCGHTDLFAACPAILLHHAVKRCPVWMGRSTDLSSGHDHGAGKIMILISFLNGPISATFLVYFRLFYMTQIKYKLILALRVCLGLKPGAAKWKA